MQEDLSLQELISHLENQPLFSGAEAAQLEKIAAAMEQFTLPPGDLLLRMGDHSDGCLYLLLAGRLQAAIDQENNQVLVLGEITPGRVVGEVGFLTGLPRTANVIAAETCRLAGISRSRYIELLAQHPQQIPEMENLIRSHLRVNRLAAMLPAFFGPMTPETFDEIYQLVEWVEVPGDTLLVRQGEPGDSMFFLVSGRLRVILNRLDGVLQVIGERLPGEIIGEMGVLTGESRSADIYAVRDSQLARISRAGFEQLTEKHPYLLRQVIQIVIQRFKITHAPVLKTMTNITLVPLHSDIPVEEVAQQLYTRLSTIDKTLLLSSSSLDGLLHMPGIAQTPQEHPDNIKISTWMDEQEQTYQFLLASADPTRTAWTERCLRQADRVLYLAWAAGAPETVVVPPELHPAPGSPVQMIQELVLLHDPARIQPAGTGQWLDHLAGITRHHHIRLGHPGDLDRLGRVLTGKAIGLVMSGGGARGFAHVGVIKALEARGIPVDFIGGSSMGALVGALYAMGWGSDTMFDKVHTLLKPKKVMDLTLPFVSFTAGKYFTETLQELFQDMQIEDTWREYFCITANLTRAEEIVNRRGPIWKALRASTAIPMIFSPVYESGDLIVDGGVMNNLPLNVLKGLSEIGTLIGVDTSLEEDLTHQDPFEPTLSGWKLLWQRLNPFTKKTHVPSIFSILMRALELHTVTNKAAYRQLADIYIRPDVSGFTTFQFDAFEELIERGYQAAVQALNAWEASESASVVRE